MRSFVRYAVGAKFQLCKALGSPIIPDENSTLNEAINISEIIPYQPAIPTAGMEMADDYNYQTDSANVKLQYLAIGNGGHYYVTNATHGIPKTLTRPHLARHTGLFNWMPFVVREVGDDLTADQRLNYRMRKIVNISGVNYICYFLRKHDLSQSSIVQRLVKKDQGVKTSTPYTPTINDLNPDSAEINGINDGTYIQTYVQTTLSFDSVEAEWLRNAAAVWFGDPDLAIISEIAICSGVDKPITKRYPISGNQTPQTVNSSLKEAQCVQVSFCESLHLPMTFTNGSVTERIYVGTEDVLYGVAGQ